MTTKKKAANGTGSIRRRKDGRWEGQYVAGYNGCTGKIIRRSVYGKTQKEVRKKLTDITKSLDSGTYKTPNKITVSQWLDEWINVFCAHAIKPLTLTSYKSIAKNYINPRIGAIQLQGLRGSHIQKIYNDMFSDGLSPKTIKNVSAVIHKALSTAQKQGIINQNPSDTTDIPKIQKHEIKPFTEAEIPLFISECAKDIMGIAFIICLLSGLREGECMGLQWDAVDFQSKRITIRQQLQREQHKGGKYYIATTKSNKIRVIAPPPIAFDYLREEHTRQLERQLKAGESWCNHWDLVFTDELGGHYKTSTFYKHFKRLASKIGRPDARPHDLRHTAATIAIANGADIKSVQAMMGHATAAFTMDIYTHASEKMMDDTADRVQRYYKNLKNG